MDEPFSAIDPINRSLLQNELLKLQKIYNKTIVFVTHDIQEAVKIADKICIMKNGKIVQFDTPNNILKNPINELGVRTISWTIFFILIQDFVYTPQDF